jgi:hypothetical protein
MAVALIALTLAAVTSGGPSTAVPLPPGELRGQVMRAEGGPVTSFTVNGVRFTDPQGRFKVLTPPQGEFRVVVRAEGLAPNVFHVQGASGKKLQIPEITLGQGEHVLGEVLEADSGMPVTDARVTLADPAKIERLRFVRPERLAPLGVTGAGGWYELRNVARGSLVLVVSHPDYLTEFVEVSTRRAMPTVYLRRGGGIAGSVRDVRGAPVPGVRVVALSEAERDGAEVAADASGRFEMRRLRAGRYRLLAHAFGRTTDAGEVSVSDGGVAEVRISVGVRQVETPSVELAAPGPSRLASR